MNRHWVVDSVSGERVRLIDDAERVLEVDCGALPLKPEEGMVLRIATSDDGQPDLSTATRDRDAEQRLLEEAKTRLEQRGSSRLEPQSRAAASAVVRMFLCQPAFFCLCPVAERMLG